MHGLCQLAVKLAVKPAVSAHDRYADAAGELATLT